MNLQEIIDKIVVHYSFTAENYPELAGKSEDEIKKFAVRHGVLHMAKSLGKMAEFAEAQDHGDAADERLLEEGTVKMLINVLRLAELEGLKADELLGLVDGYLKPKTL